jgi:AcrR family transcriptional regulator
MNNMTAQAGPTYDALISAARRLFAESGYEGTSVRAITAEAGANLGAITYHFGSKRDLYDRVVGSVVTPLAERVAEVAGRGGSVLERVEGVVRAYFEYLAENPDLPRLMMQELTLGESPGEAVATPLRRVHGVLSGLVAEGQAAGLIGGGAPAVLGLFILSVPVHLGILQRPLKQALGMDLLDPATRQAVAESAVSFVCNGLRGPSGVQP